MRSEEDEKDEEREAEEEEKPKIWLRSGAPDAAAKSSNESEPNSDNDEDEDDDEAYGDSNTVEISLFFLFSACLSTVTVAAVVSIPEAAEASSLSRALRVDLTRPAGMSMIGNCGKDSKDEDDDEDDENDDKDEEDGKAGVLAWAWLLAAREAEAPEDMPAELGRNERKVVGGRGGESGGVGGGGRKLR
jgi:hypothetical protein